MEPNDNPDRDLPPRPSQPPGQDGSGQIYYNEPIHYEPVGARIPERLAAGVLCTGVIVFNGPDEFVIDFVQNLARPPRVAARVVVTPKVMAEFVAALRENLHKYEQTYGAPKMPPAPRIDRQPTPQEVYEGLRLSDEQLSGAYATTVMIGHSPSEFFMDFITRFFPKAAVSARVYMAASQAPGMLAALASSLQRHAGGRPPQEHPKGPV
jgi:hypothetical protein